MLNKLGLALGALAIVAFLAVTFTGTEFFDPAREQVPANVRQAPGGYRSFHFWHSGYHGGK